MVRRFGLKALTLSFLLVGAPSLWSQEPPAGARPWTGSAYTEPGADATVISSYVRGGPETGVVQAGHCTSCNFDAYRHYDDSIALAKHRPHLGGTLRSRMLSDGCAPDGSWGSYPNEDSDACDFECANCFHKWDFEKRLQYAYIHGNSHGDDTRSAYGDFHGAQVAAELLPWVLTDGDMHYSRWGFTCLFQYSNYEGNRNIVLQSRETNNFLTINDGVTYTFAIGPTYRVDFEWLGIRMSPNATVGIAFDWTTLREIPPQSLEVRRVERFKYSGFDAGGYVRLMWDFAISKSVNIGVGGDFKFVPTDVMTPDNDMRKHTGFIVQVSHQF